MKRFTCGDVVRIDIPDKTDPDYNHLHGTTGTITEIIKDDAGLTTGDQRDSYVFRVEFKNGETADVRWRDLRSA